jgi:hypothetical protein
MEKTLYWLLESNGDLSVTVQDIATAKDIIEGDFANESEDGKFEIDDLQYTVTPVMLTQAEYEALGEQD